jgi:hypothetical protein
MRRRTWARSPRTPAYRGLTNRSSPMTLGNMLQPSQPLRGAFSSADPPLAVCAAAFLAAAQDRARPKPQPTLRQVLQAMQPSEVSPELRRMVESMVAWQRQPEFQHLAERIREWDRQTRETLNRPEVRRFVEQMVESQRAVQRFVDQMAESQRGVQHFAELFVARSRGF